MPTKSHSPILDEALAAVPTAFRPRIIVNYLAVKRNVIEGRLEASGIASGKFCEVVLRFLQNKITGSSTPFGEKIRNFADACALLMGSPSSSGSESERVLIPRALLFLYTLRNKRGIGHVGGDVDANCIDMATIARVSDWIVCEMIRLYHGLSLEEAQDIVDGVSVRNMPIVWTVAGKRRVLQEGLKAADQVLLLLYSETESAVLTEDLFEWVEYSNIHMFRSKVLGGLHKSRLIEYDRTSDCAYLSPKGTKQVEDRILPDCPA